MKTIQNSRHILQKAIDTYGGDRQTWKCQEEIGEYLQAIGKIKSKKMFALKEEQERAYDNLQEEIADCIIMMEQMKILYGAAQVDKWISYKLTRLEANLSDPCHKEPF